MQKVNETYTALLNDLIRINNDRIAGYSKVFEQLEDGRNNDLKPLFDKMKTDSRELIRELSKVVSFMGGEPETGTTGAGKLYRFWLGLKDTFSIITSRKTILAHGEQIEDAVQRAYARALDEPDLPAEISSLLISQKSFLEGAHKQIKALRDMQEV